jgi:hypothetical protein
LSLANLTPPTAHGTVARTGRIDQFGSIHDGDSLRRANCSTTFLSRNGLEEVFLKKLCGKANSHWKPKVQELPPQSEGHYQYWFC